MHLSPILNIETYNTRMRAPLLDKVFFLDKISDITEIVDYGCADGSLLGFIHEIDPSIKLTGYDNDPQMLAIARLEHPNITFTNKLPTPSSKGSLLVLSSVIHEVYSYMPLEKISAFWKYVLGAGFEYVAIRDMSLVRAFFEPKMEQDTITKEEAEKVKLHANPEFLHSYEERWAPVVEGAPYKELVHWLLKYRYTDNWARENNENYFPLTYEDLKRIIYHSAYEVVYEEKYILPWIANKIKEDFDIKLDSNTHIKLILHKKTV